MTPTALDRFMEAMREYASMNRPPAVEEPANPFEKLVNDWYELQQLQVAIKDAMKLASGKELQVRTQIADGLKEYLAGNLNEGVNNYELSNGRKLKMTHKVTRTISEPDLPAAKQDYLDNAQPGDLTFEELLRVKYELDKRNYDKVSAPANKAFSRCLVTKPAAPTLEVD